MSYLLVEKGRKQGRVDLGETACIIGRNKTCSLVLDDLQVSREHAQIVREDDSFYIEDLKSRHGTFVNGRRITGRFLLADNDAIVVCDNSFTFHAEAALEPEEKPIIMSTLDATAAGEELAEVRPEAKLRALLEINRSLQSILRVDDLLPKILECLFRIFPQAQRGVILLVDQASGRLVPKATANRDQPTDETVRISQTVVNRALERKEAILSADASLDAQFKLSQSISSLRIRSILCAPLLSQGQKPLGILQVHTEDPTRAFTEEDLTVLVSVASATAMALENAALHEELVAQERMLRELELARDVQRRFLPASRPRVPGYAFYSFYQAAREVGGDYYSFLELPQDRLAIALGDVSGKGMPAAMLMARLSSDVRYSIIAATDPGAALQSVNRSLAEAEMEDKFVTLLLMVLDKARHTLTVANAGHMFPLLKRAQGGIEEVGKGLAGLPLNVSLNPEYEYRTVTVSLEPGATVLAYTDGVSEATNAAGEMFGFERLRACFERAPLDPARAGQCAVEAALQFAAGQPQHDDMTLICFGREGP